MDEMNLKEFVRSSITQIIEGVSEAISESGSSGTAVVNPNRSHGAYTDPECIEFDVAVTVADKTDVDGKAGISVIGIKVGGGVESAFENKAVSRLSFRVPVSWPSVKREQYANSNEVEDTLQSSWMTG